MLSGRSTTVLANAEESVEEIVSQCCGLLEIHERGTEALVHGTEVVPATAQVRNWPDIRPQGEVSEYQLVV
eukprot:4977619-Amphidinium_carterae.1